MEFHASEESAISLEIEKYINRLSDVARLCADLFYGQSSLRKRLLAHSQVTSAARNIISKSITDHLLLGADFSKRWKHSQESEKAGKEMLKKPQHKPMKENF